MEPRVQKAFDFACDSTKQLIALATGIVALTVTFSKDILGGVDVGPRSLLMAAWSVYLISIVCGVWTLLALTGSLEPLRSLDKLPAASIRGKNVTLPSIVQIGTFLLATALVVVFGIWTAGQTKEIKPEVKKEPPKITAPVK
jgi:hypothetical protein